MSHAFAIAQAAIYQPPGHPADTAWMLAAACLACLLVPALALYYGGMVRRKNILSMMTQVMAAAAVVGVPWLLLGYTLAFGDSVGGVVGWSPSWLGMGEALAGRTVPGTSCPVYVHALFEGALAVFAAGLVCGAFAERARFGPACLLMLLWSLLVYAPLAHWVWAVDAAGRSAGWLGRLGVLDGAGGTVVHLAAGAAGLAAALVLQPRKGHPAQVFPPGSVVLTLAGAGLLGLGWLGAAGGSSLGVSPRAAAAVAATPAAAAAAALAWLVLEWWHCGKPTALGLATGLVAGLAAGAPAAGLVSPGSAVLIGLLAGAVCYAAVNLRPWLRCDDSLDVTSIHGVGGALGVVLTGALASGALLAVGGATSTGLWQLFVQVLAVIAAGGWSFAVTAFLVWAIDKSFGFCVSPAAEATGLDLAIHGEVALELGPEMEPHSLVPCEPRSATAPAPTGHKRRFTVVVEGAAEAELLHAWSELCQSGLLPPAAEFRVVYPYLTTVTGNRFHFRGGDPAELRVALQQLLEDRLDGTPIHAYVED